MTPAAGRGEAFEVVQLDGEADRADRVDAAEAAQRGDGAGVAGVESETFDVDDEGLRSLLDVFDGEEIVGDDDRVGRVVEAERLEPAAVSGVQARLPGMKVMLRWRRNLLMRWRARTRSSRRSSRARERSRAASSSSVSGWTSVKSPARKSRASFLASRRSVLMRSPGLRGMSEGATSMQLASLQEMIWRCRA